MQAAPKPEQAAPVQQQRQQRPTLPGVIFDSDMGANIDAALALAVLHGASAKVKIIGVTVSNPSLDSAAYCDILGRFYASGGKLNTVPYHYHEPVGYPGDGTKSSASAMLAKPLSLTEDAIKDINGTADVAIIFRNALMTQKDGDGVIVVAGPLTNLIRAMTMPGNKELIAAKAGLLVVAAGSFTDNVPDPRIKADVAAARKIVAEWPSPIVFVGREVGSAVPYPGASIATDYSWAPTHPVVEAYKAYKPLPYDAPSQAVIAALYATTGKDDLFKLSEPGKIEIGDDGRTRFVPSASGKDRYILTESDPAWKERVVKEFTTLASAKPAAPAGRGGGFRQNQAAQAAGAVPPVKQP